MNDWSLQEVDLIIADYFSMLVTELANTSYSKAQHRRNLAVLIQGRGEGSIEFKHQNISAILVKLGLPFVTGYKPRWNYQRLLEERVIAYLDIQKKNLETHFAMFAQSKEAITQPKLEFHNLIEEPPTKKVDGLVEDRPIEYARRPIKVNYLEREQKNSLLGKLGEEFVLQYERWLLINAGKEALADKIEWIAKHDDGAGFDILSKKLDGSDKYIEVKTTKLTKETPIFFTSNEYEFAREKGKNFNLYRLFNFTKSPRMFIVNGEYDEFCLKEATQFKGIFQ